MSEIMPTDEDLQVQAIDWTPGKYELISTGAVQEWLNSVSSGTSLFGSLLPKASAIHELTDRTADKWAFTAILGSFGAVLGSIPGLIIDPTTWSSLIGAGAGVTLTAGSVLFAGSKVVNKTRIRSEKIKKVQAQGLQAWLKSRYGILVNIPVLTVLAYDSLLGRSSSFVDIKGQSWVMKYSEKDSGWFVEPEKSITADEAKTIEKVIVEAALPGELGVIFGSIESRLDLLKNYSFAAKTSHNLLRISEDARQAVVSFRKLEALGEGESGESQLVRVLSALNDELLAVIQQEAEDVRNDLTVQGNYVLSRHLETGVNSAIRLEGQKSVNATIDADLSEKE
jgi:hypothetical protein